MVNNMTKQYKNKDAEIRSLKRALWWQKHNRRKEKTKQQLYNPLMRPVNSASRKVIIDVQGKKLLVTFSIIKGGR